MKDQNKGILDVISGDKPLQLGFDPIELVKIGVTIVGAVFIAILLASMVTGK